MINNMHDLQQVKCFGSAVVGPKGQVVIPVNARKELGIGTGDTLLAFDVFKGQALLFLKTEAVEQMLGMMSERMARFEKMMADFQSGELSKGDGGD